MIFGFLINLATRDTGQVFASKCAVTIFETLILGLDFFAKTQSKIALEH